MKESGKRGESWEERGGGGRSQPPRSGGELEGGNEPGNTLGKDLGETRKEGKEPKETNLGRRGKREKGPSPGRKNVYSTTKGFRSGFGSLDSGITRRFGRNPFTNPIG
jgi:hypothetical protein